MSTFAGLQGKTVLAVTAALSVVAVVIAGGVMAFGTPTEMQNTEVVSLQNLGVAGGWSMTGATGAVDESDLDIYKTSSSGKVTVKSSGGLPATLNMRFPVTANENMKGTFLGAYLMFRFRDNGDNARIVCKLKSIDMQTGVVTTLLALDSNDFPPSNSYQLQSILQGNAGTFFNFDFKTYWVEASITRRSSQGKPGLALVVVGKTDI